MSTTAQIKAKGCQSTGITEELATKFHDQLGKTVMAVVELRSDSRTENTDGDQKVSIEILSIEPAVDPNGAGEAHLRNFARSLYYERQLLSADAQPTLESVDDIEPKVADVIAAQAGAVPHEYVREGKTGNCEVCGNDPFHHLHETSDPDEANEDTQGDDEPAQDLEPATS